MIVAVVMLEIYDWTFARLGASAVAGLCIWSDFARGKFSRKDPIPLLKPIKIYCRVPAFVLSDVLGIERRPGSVPPSARFMENSFLRVGWNSLWDSTGAVFHSVE